MNFIKSLKSTISYNINLFVEMCAFRDADKTRGDDERIVIPVWNLAKNVGGFYSWAHIQRYEWVAPFVQGLNCLDAGCGSGYGTNYLARQASLQVVGVDLSSDAIFFAQKHYKRANLTFNQMDVLDLKFGDSTFDAVISFDVIEHLRESEQERFIVEVSRVLKSDGTAYIGCPNSLVSAHDNVFHKNELTPQEFERLLRKQFGHVWMFCQDVVIDGQRQGELFAKSLQKVSYSNLCIFEQDCNSAFGLLANCQKLT